MKTMSKVITLATFVALLLISCATPVQEEAIDLDKLKVEIQAMEDAYAAGEKAKDADAVTAYYADDIVNYGNHKEPITSKASLKEKIAERLAQDTTGNYNQYKVVDLFAEGNMAVEIGSWTEYDSAGNELDNGHYMSYFEKRDGKYVCVRDMSNTTKKLPIPEAIAAE